VVGVLLASVFCAVAFAYVCTEFAMSRFGVRERLIVGQSGLAMILAVNLLSLMLVWAGASALVAVTGHPLYLHVTVIAIAAQAVWLGYDLWLYRRDHLRVRYEN